ncbi:MAG: glycine zipper family protein [Candidatus Hydrogenedentes bacterium]|nr:glycine zipper family protein [Candidatus Hydrogenedentota bacterium]
MRSMLLPLMALGMAIAVSGCETTPAEDGAVLGAALGAGTGAIIGNQSGHAGEGALIGAGIGALTGAIIGDAVGDSRQPQYAQPRPAAPSPVAAPVTTGHYENRLIVTPSGEMYEQRVWVPHY